MTAGVETLSYRRPQTSTPIPGPSSASPMVRLAAFGDLSPREIAFLQTMVRNGQTLSMSKGADVRSEFGASRGLYILERGWVSASNMSTAGRVQIFKLHLTGDVLGAPSLAFNEHVELLTALTDADVTFISEGELQRMFVECQSLAYRFFLGAQQERAFLMDRMAVGGQLAARHAVAAFLVDLHARMERVELTAGNRIALPITQEQLGQLLGLSSVHINRTLKQLEADRLILRMGRDYDLVEIDRLRAFCEAQERGLIKISPKWFGCD